MNFRINSAVGVAGDDHKLMICFCPYNYYNIKTITRMNIFSLFINRLLLKLKFKYIYCKECNCKDCYEDNKERYFV